MMTDVSTPTPSEDFNALTDLWQAGGEVPVDGLIEKLQQQNRKLRRLNQLSFLVCIVALIFTAILEFFGRIPTAGLLTLISSIAIIGSWWKYRRDKAKLIAAYSEEPEKLLPFLIKRVKAARNLGRYYYCCTLPSVALGYGFAHFTDDGGSADQVSETTLFILVAIGLTALIGITGWGIRLAHQKTIELRELETLYADLHR